MKALFGVALLALHSTAFAFDDNCEGTLGSTYVEACQLSKNVEEMNKQLNKKYQEILKGYKRDRAAEEAKLLVEAQRAWIRYRDKVCKFEDQAYGGIDGISWIRCQGRVTNTRLDELNGFGD